MLNMFCIILQQTLEVVVAAVLLATTYNEKGSTKS